MFSTFFVKYLQENKITAYQLSKETGISQGLISDYKNGAKKPTIDNLIKISDFFNCSIDAMLGRVGEEEREIELIKKFRQLTEEGKNAVINYADFTLSNPKYKKYTNISKEA